MTDVEDKQEEKEPEQKTLFGMVNGQPLKIPIIGLCGAKGSGKTLAGLSIDPNNTVEVAVEDSSVTYNIPVKKRYSLYDEVQAAGSNGIPTPIECWEWFVSKIEDIDGRILFVDPITDLQSGLVDWVKANPEKFGKTRNQYEKASGLLWADVKSHLKIVLGRLSRRVECFVFTAHMGSVWKGGAPVAGKIKAKGVDTFYELASLYLYLQRNADPKTGKVPAQPTASIVPPLGKSRLAITSMVDGELQAVPILPPTTKLFTWKKLREFVVNPPNYSKLKKDELAESQDLTEDERLQLQAEIAEANREAEELKSSRLEAVAEAAKRNQEARSTAATAETRKEVASSPKDAGKDTGEEKQTEQVSKEPIPIEELQQIVRKQFKEIGMSKEQAVGAIERRGGKGAKLADLPYEKLDDLRKALWRKMTEADLDSKK